MPIHFRNKLALQYIEVIRSKFDFLVEYFNFEPGDIFIEIVPLDYFDRFIEFERGYKPQAFVVGSALDNGKIIILDKKDFPKKIGHTEEEFEDVIVHEMCHIFLRRIIFPKSTFIWIQEGICEYLAFGKKGFKINNPINFTLVEDYNGWNKYHPYQQAGAFFLFLSKKFGDEKIAEYIKKLKNQSEIYSFKEVFGDFNYIQSIFFKEMENEKIISSRDIMQK